MLTWLPKDVQHIVYRYIFDRNYKRVLMNYRSVWLNTGAIVRTIRTDVMFELELACYWDDEEHCFCNGLYYCANRRDCTLLIYSDIYELNIVQRRSKGLLPENW